MKGAFSSPEGVLDRVVLNELFPDTAMLMNQAEIRM